MTDAMRAGLRSAGGKASSARWLATVCACLIWGILTWRDRISQEFNASMIALILNWYFQSKKDAPTE
jgi:hypothetical protein